MAGTIRELTQAGTYTIYVWVYDVWGNGTSCFFSFIIPEQIVVIGPNGNTLELPYDTEIDFGKGTSVGSGSVQMKEVFTPPSYSGYRIVGKTVSFYYGTVSLYEKEAKFTKGVKLTLCYTEEDLAGGDESKLYIYGRAGGSWSKLGGTVDKNTNKISYDIMANTPICEMYAIMTEYSVPKNVSEGIYVKPNPAKGNATFVVGVQDADVKVEVYTLTGDLVWEKSGHAASGGIEIPWIPYTNNAGREVGTGLYIYKVTIEYDSGKKEEVIKKMVVIKQ